MSINMTGFSARESVALGSAVAVALVAWLYFPSAFMVSTGDVRVWVSANDWVPLDKTMLLRFATGTVVLLAVIEIVQRAVIARFMWREFRTPADERERLIRMRARGAAYVAMLSGGVALLACLYLTQPPALLAAQYFLLLACASEFTRHAATVILYRLSV